MNWVDEVLKMLKVSEGYRQYAYPDPLSKLFKKYPRAKWGFRPARAIVQELGYTGSLEDGAPWTVGYGYTHGVTPDTEFSVGMAEHKLKEVVQDCVIQVAKLVPNFQDQPDVIKAVLVDMCYNMGARTLATFKNTLRNFIIKDYDQAAKGMEASLWAKQVGNRAKRLVRMVRTLKFEE